LILSDIRGIFNGMPRKPFSYADHAWLRMNDPNNLMIITAMMTFDTPVDYERLKDTVEHSLLRFKRFHQRMVQPRFSFQRPYWENDPNFKIEAHLRRISLPPPHDQRTLQELISLLMGRDLDYSRPLWQFYLVENYGDGSAFIARLHHSMGDGIALMQVLLTLTEPALPLPPASQPRAALQSKDQSPNEPIQTLKSTTIHTTHWGAKDMLEEGKKMLLDPSHAVGRARQGIDFAAAVGKLALRWPDPQTVFKGPLGKGKRAAVSEPLELRDIKFIGKTLNGTVNDVLVTAVAGALGRYVDYRGKTAEDLNIRSFIPVNLRPVALDEDLGNKFGLVFLSLPIGIKDPVERLRKVKQNMDELKSSAEAVATFGIINLIGAVPSWLEEIAVTFFDTKGTTIMTNVPGPRSQLTMAGAPISTIMAWVPQSGRISLGFSIISYNDKVWLGVATDQGLIPDPETIVSMFYQEYEEMIIRAQKTQAERQEQILPMLAMLDEAMQTMDELLAEAGEDAESRVE
jgi:diacylglycerol O-acyltransferase